MTKAGEFFSAIVIMNHIELERYGSPELADMANDGCLIIHTILDHFGLWGGKTEKI